MLATCHIGLGSNLADRQSNLQEAIARIARLAGTEVVRLSRFVETTAVGGRSPQPSFLNAAAELRTRHTPHQLLAALLDIEHELGRERTERWGPRTIDLDILLWGVDRIESPELVVPHPRMHFRRFVLEPLAEIAPGARHPSGWTIGQQWQRLNRLPHYLAITGPMGVGKSTVARLLAERLGAVRVDEDFDSALLGRYYSGSHGEAAAVQASFLERRRAQLELGRWTATPPKWVVSDYWFGQSLAYAAAMFDVDGTARDRAEFELLAAGVLAPTLVAWLDAPEDELLRRIARRGRAFESPVTAEFLRALRGGYARVLAGPGGPPAYRPEATQVDAIVDELCTVAAAIEG